MTHILSLNHILQQSSTGYYPVQCILDNICLAWSCTALMVTTLPQTVLKQLPGCLVDLKIRWNNSKLFNVSMDQLL